MLGHYIDLLEIMCVSRRKGALGHLYWRGTESIGAKNHWPCPPSFHLRGSLRLCSSVTPCVCLTAECFCLPPVSLMWSEHCVCLGLFHGELWERVEHALQKQEQLCKSHLIFRMVIIAKVTAALLAPAHCSPPCLILWPARETHCPPEPKQWSRWHPEGP